MAGRYVAMVSSVHRADVIQIQLSNSCLKSLQRVNYMNKLLLIIAITFSLIACQKATSPSNGATSVKITQDFSVTDFTICEVVDGKTSCIYPSSALHDLYNKNGDYIDTVSNFMAIPHVGIGSIVRAVKFSDGKDIYAFFFTQLNEFDESGKIASCHACSPLLGIMAYQFHNEWKPFLNKPIVGNYGAWGRIGFQSVDKFEPLNIYSLAPEKFLITVLGGDGGQGYNDTFIQLIMVGNGMSNKDVRSLGFITTGKTNCSGNASDWHDWRGEVSYAFESGNEYPLIKVKKVYQETCKDVELKIPSEVYEYKYDWKKNKYISTRDSG